MLGVPTPSTQFEDFGYLQSNQRISLVNTSQSNDTFQFYLEKEGYVTASTDAVDATLSLLSSSGRVIEQSDSDLVRKIIPGLYFIKAETPSGKYAIQVKHSRNPDLPPLKFEDMQFIGHEGAVGTVKVSLKQKPLKPITAVFNPDRIQYTTADTDGDITNVTKKELKFTPKDWNKPKTIAFVAEWDNTSSNAERELGYEIQDGNRKKAFEKAIGTVTNTYAPDPTKFNVLVDYRMVENNPAWTQARRSWLEQEINKWVARIRNELQPYDDRFNVFIDQAPFSTYAHVDDMIIFISEDNTPGALARTGAMYGNLAGEDTYPRLITMRFNSDVYQDTELQFRELVSHEMTHALGMVALEDNGLGFQHLQGSPVHTAFNGPYARAANGNQAVPLYSQDTSNEDDRIHVRNSVNSIMVDDLDNAPSSFPTTLDWAILADHGWLVQGVN